MSGRHGQITDSGKRQRTPSLSETGAALQQAEDEVTGLKADLAKARAASAKWKKVAFLGNPAPKGGSNS
jgi:hypothetical protein